MYSWIYFSLFSQFSFHRDPTIYAQFPHFQLQDVRNCAGEPHERKVLTWSILSIKKKEIPYTLFIWLTLTYRECVVESYILKVTKF